MAEPGDPTVPRPTDPAVPPVRPAAAMDPAVDHDDLIGFSSAAALQGRPRPVATPRPEGVVEPESPLQAEPDLFDPVEPSTPSHPAPLAAPPAAPAPYVGVPTPTLSMPAPPKRPPPVPAWAIETPVAPDMIRSSSRVVDAPKDIESANSLYAVYALILFAVPTLGVSAVIALLAVTGRPGPGGAAAASHFVFQQRTLWAGAVVAFVGAILIAVGLGVFVLFIVAVWLILRGASGILALKAGCPVRDPRGWFLA